MAGKPSVSDSVIHKRMGRITELMTNGQDDNYASFAGRLRKARQLFHQLVAEQLAEPLNEQLRSTPHDSLEQKQQLARWTNAELRALGVAIRCPKTGEAAMLHAHSGNHPKRGRFQIGLIEVDSGRKKTVSSPELLTLELMAHPMRREPLAEYWARRVSGNGDQGRGRS